MGTSRPILRRFQVGLLGGLLAVCLVPASVFAAATDEVVRESITLSPVAKHYEIKAGESKQDSFTVINDGKEAYDFTVYARPYYVANEEYDPVFDLPDPKLNIKNADAYRWVQFEKSSYHLKAGTSSEVRFTVRVPESAAPGGHYGVMFAETQPEMKANGNAVLRKKRVGSILYVTVSGDVTTSGKQLSASAPFLQFQPPLIANTRIRNDGNVDFSVKTTMNVSDMFGGKKYHGEREVAVLPETTRKIDVSWPTANWFGLYKVELTTKFLDTTKTSSHYVLMMPLWIYLLIGLLVGGRIVYALAHRRRR